MYVTLLHWNPYKMANGNARMSVMTCQINVTSTCSKACKANDQNQFEALNYRPFAPPYKGTVIQKAISWRSINTLQSQSNDLYNTLSTLYWHHWVLTHDHLKLWSKVTFKSVNKIRYHLLLETSPWSSVAIWRYSTSLVQIMACRQIRAKPPFIQCWFICWLHPQEQMSVKFESDYAAIMLPLVTKEWANNWMKSWFSSLV